MKKRKNKSVASAFIIIKYELHGIGKSSVLDKRMKSVKRTDNEDKQQQEEQQLEYHVE